MGDFSYRPDDFPIIALVPKIPNAVIQPTNSQPPRYHLCSLTRVNLYGGALRLYQLLKVCCGPGFLQTQRAKFYLDNGLDVHTVATAVQVVFILYSPLDIRQCVNVCRAPTLKLGHTT